MRLQRLYEDGPQAQAAQIRSDMEVSMERTTLAYDVTKIGTRLRVASDIAGREADMAGGSMEAQNRRGWALKASFLAKKADNLATEIML